MTLLQIVVVLAALLCSLVAGFLFAFAVVVMPGIARLDDEAFLRAFKTMDGVIQRNQPLFMVVWVGSVAAAIAAGALGLVQLGDADRLLAAAAALVYLVGVQVPTAAVNIPLNNELQRLDPAVMDGTARRRARDRFEARWNRSNRFRSVCAGAASILLLLLLIRL